MARITTGQLTDATTGYPVPDDLRGMADGQTGTTRLLLWWPDATDDLEISCGLARTATRVTTWVRGQAPRTRKVYVGSIGIDGDVVQSRDEGNAPMVDEGTFSMPFEMTLTRQ